MVRYDFYDKKSYNGRILVCKKGKFGFIDESGEEIIPCKYDNAYAFCHGNAIVCINSKWGVINVDNEVILPINHVRLDRFKPDLFIIDIDDGYSLLDSKYNKLFNITFDKIIRIGLSNQLIISQKNKYGVLDISKGVLIPMIYDQISYIDNDLWKVTLNQKQGIVNIDNDIIIEPIYDSISYSNHKHFYVVKNNKLGIIAKDGSMIIQPIYNNIYPITDELFKVQNSNGKFGVIDINGNIMIPFIYSSLTDYFCCSKGVHVYIASLNNKYGVLDAEGKPIVDFSYDYIDEYFWNEFGILKVNLHGKYGLISHTGEVYTQVKYDHIRHFDVNALVSIVSISEKLGCVNIHGEEIIPVEYENIQVLSDGYIKVNSKKKQGLFSWEGEQITEIIYDRINIRNLAKYAEVTLNSNDGYLYFN